MTEEELCGFQFYDEEDEYANFRFGPWYCEGLPGHEGQHHYNGGSERRIQWDGVTRGGLPREAR